MKMDNLIISQQNLILSLKKKNIELQKNLEYCEDEKQKALALASKYLKLYLEATNQDIESVIKDSSEMLSKILG